MEEEIDLREYIVVLIKRWKWITALTVIAALVAAVLSFFVLSPKYEALALVLITNPRYQLRFDPRLETLSEIETESKVYPALAMGDDLLELVLERAADRLPPEQRQMDALKAMLNASAAADPSLVELKVVNGDPELAAWLANVWAEQYVAHVNELYGYRSEDVTFFESRLEEARQALEEAEEALVAYEARNQASVLQARLNAKRSALNKYLKAQHDLQMIIKDAQVLRQQWEQQPANAQTALADELAALLLEIQGLSQDGGGVPLQLQVTEGGSLSNRTVGEQIQLLDNLIDGLEERLVEAEKQAAVLSEEILPLQEALQEANTERTRLARSVEVARNTYMTLANKVEETRIAAQDETGEVRLASRAAVPQKPVSPKKKLNVAIAGFLGLFVGVFVAFFVEWWQAPVSETPQSERQAGRDG